jgi:hypothetical protein
MTDEKLVSWKSWKAGISNTDKNKKSFTKKIDTGSLEDNISIESSLIALNNTETKPIINKKTAVNRSTTFADISKKIKKNISITNRNENSNMSTSLCIYNNENMNENIKKENSGLRRSFTILQNTQNNCKNSVDYDNDWKTKYRTQILNRSNTTLNNKKENKLKDQLNQSLSIEDENIKEEDCLSLIELVKNKNSNKSKIEIDYNKNCTDVQKILSALFFTFYYSQSLSSSSSHLI